MNKHFSQWRAGRESRASKYFAVLFGSAVLTIFAIRIFLAVAGYPQLGGGNLHIAHMLWGGFFMLISIVIFIYLHGYRAKFLAAFFGGVGFGFFIDELGKFITSDNDYFYQPTAMFIYIIFLLLWALFNWLDNYYPVTKNQIFIDLLTRIRDASVNGMTETDKIIINQHMDELRYKNDDKVKIFKQINYYAPEYKHINVAQKINKFADLFNKKTADIIANKHGKNFIYIMLTLAAIVNLVLFAIGIIENTPIWQVDEINTPLIVSYGLAITSGIMTFFVFMGFWSSLKSWAKALVWYRRALLVNVFGVQIFLFYTHQFEAAFGVVFSLVMLYIIGFLIKQIELNKYNGNK